jgi:hypothetical protein
MKENNLIYVKIEVQNADHRFKSWEKDLSKSG